MVSPQYVSHRSISKWVKVILTDRPMRDIWHYIGLTIAALFIPPPSTWLPYYQTSFPCIISPCCSHLCYHFYLSLFRPTLGTSHNYFSKNSRMKAWHNWPLSSRRSTRHQLAKLFFSRYPKATTHFLRQLMKLVRLFLPIISSWFDC